MTSITMPDPQISDSRQKRDSRLFLGHPVCTICIILVIMKFKN